MTGALTKLEDLRASASPAVKTLNDQPSLDPKRVLSVYKNLGIASVDELRERLDTGDIERLFGSRTAQHVRQGLTEAHAILLYKADDLRLALEEYLLNRCGVQRAEAAGDYRRRVEVVEELVFVVEANDFPSVVAHVERYGGRTPLITSGEDHALFSMSSGVLLRLQRASRDDWGIHMVSCTGSKAHLKQLNELAGTLRPGKSGEIAVPTEATFYRGLGLQYIEPELREGGDEIERAARNALPRPVNKEDFLGDLHAHTRSSDGVSSIEEMAEAAKTLGYEYVGITDHSQSLKIARGVPASALLDQIRQIDKLNGRLRNFQVLKSSEVDILQDGSLDYPDEILRELDYTVCSIHSRFGLGKREQTDRILRAMGNPFFNILGHATGRLLLKRPGYEVDMDRINERARQNGCCFEINSSPDRLDLSAEHARHATEAGVMIAVSTDAHSTGEFGLIRCGIDQARRAGLEKAGLLNCQPLAKLRRHLWSFPRRCGMRRGSQERVPSFGHAPSRSTKPVSSTGRQHDPLIPPNFGPAARLDDQSSARFLRYIGFSKISVLNCLTAAAA
ncbi:MAG TPA: PHP domain-containing protein [Bryobacteraceae bacterium]|nr:PHP domain-containing protein [Bryobacteraceae bacterium]